MVENNKYGWDHAPNGKWHPVGEWIPWPEAEADKGLEPFGNRKYDAYRREHDWFRENQRRYDALVTRWTKTPNKWFAVSFHGVSFNPTACFSVDDVVFRTDFTREDLKHCYADPKKQKVTNALYGANQDEIVHGLKEDDWVWRVKLDMKDGVLVPTELRAISKSLDSIFLDFRRDKKKEVSAAIAAVSPNGFYIVKTKQAGWFPKKNGEKGEWLVIPYEILSGQARGYQGALFYDEKQSSDRYQLGILERALGLEKGGLAELRRKHYWRVNDQKIMYLTRYFKAHFNFCDKYVKPEDLRKAEEREVESWL